MDKKQSETDMPTEQQEEQLYRTCLSKLQMYFDDELEGEEAGKAIQVSNMLTKRKQTMHAKEAIHFAMAQSLASNPADLRRYIEATAPQVIRLIGSGKQLPDTTK